MKKFIRELEFNNVTDDISNDIKHLNIKSYIKFYLFYGSIVLFSIGAIIGLKELILSDKFRQGLFKSGVSPINTLFYSDYSSDKKELEELKEKKERELNTLRNNQSQTFSKSSYSYKDFLADIKDEKIKVNLDETIKEMEAFKFYLANYFTAYVLQNKDKSITINNNEYTYYGLVEKVKNMNSSEALTQLSIPSKIILKDLKLDEDDNLNVETMAIVLHNLTRVTNEDFYISLNMKDFSINNGVKLIKEAILNNEYRIVIKANNGELVNQFNISRLDTQYNEQLEIQKAEQETKHKHYLENKSKIDKQISKLNEDISNISKAMYEIDKLQREPINYAVHEENIEKLLDNVKGY